MFSRPYFLFVLSAIQERFLGQRLVFGFALMIDFERAPAKTLADIFFCSVEWTNSSSRLDTLHLNTRRRANFKAVSTAVQQVETNAMEADNPAVED